MEDEKEELNEALEQDRVEGVDYDEEGNVILTDIEEEHDDTFDEFEDEEEVAEDVKEEEKKEEPKAEVKEESKETEDQKKVKELEEKLSAKDRRIKDFLKGMGYEDGDDASLDKILADYHGKTVDQVKQERETAERTKAAEELLKRKEFEAKMTADLKEIQDNFVEAKDYKSLLDMPNKMEFAKLRDKGYSAKDAYIVSHLEQIRATAASAGKQEVLDNGKQHLKSVVTKGVVDTGPHMTRADLAEMREWFPNKSDKEIEALWKKTQN